MEITNEETKISYKDWLYAFFLLCLSGNPFFPEVFSEWIYIGSAVAIYLLNRRKLFVDKAIRNRFFKWMIDFTILFFAQYLFVTPVSIPADLNFLAKFSIAFMIPCILGPKFRYAYFRAIAFTAAVSLIFFGLYYFGGWYTGMSFDRVNSIIVYNQILGGEPRNSGMFWEPGAFQGYINLVPLMFLSDLKYLWKIEKLRCTILLLALLTTFSTTGYIVLMITLATIVIKDTKNIFLKVAVSAVIVFGIIYSFTSVDFLGEKIKAQYENALIIEQGDVSWSRFGAAVVDYYEIARHPIVGNGFVMDARYPKLGGLMSGSGNGFTGAINMFGIVIILFYLVQLYKFSPGKILTDKCLFFFAVALLMQGEFFINYPMFWALLFVVYPNNKDQSL